MALFEGLSGRARRGKRAIFRELDRMSGGGKDLDTTDLPSGWIPRLESLQRRLNEEEEERLRSEARNRLAVAGVAHDMKLPISVILGSVECIREGMDDKDYLQGIQEQAERMNEYVLTLNETAKQESKEAPDEKEEIDTREFFTAVAENFLSIAEARKVRYKIKRFPKVRIYGERTRLARVLENLLNNAFKHTQEGGRITVSATAKGKVFRLSVKDNGSGIQKKNIPFVFDKFYMEEGSRAGGSGLGLYITKQIVKQHGGNIGVKSKQGKGSTFYFTLPMQQIKTKYLTDRFNNHPLFVKLLLMLLFGWCLSPGYRFVRFAETQCAPTLWGAFIAIVFMPFVWLLDTIGIVFYGQITFLSE